MAIDSTPEVWADGPRPPKGRCLVSVELDTVKRDFALPPEGGSGAAAGHSALALSLAVSTPHREVVLSATPGAAQPGEHRVLDEHFVVDADIHEAQRWRQLADVLYGSRARSAAEASRWLLAVTSAHDTCRIAAVPLVRGGWAVLDTAERQVTVVPVTTAHRPWLLPSCLLGWLTSGGTLQELAEARLDCFAVFAVLPADSGGPAS
jgi:hypothetical protein